MHMSLWIKPFAVAAGVSVAVLVLLGAAAVQQINGDVVVNGTLTANSLKIAPDTSVSDELINCKNQIAALQRRLDEQERLLRQTREKVVAFKIRRVDYERSKLPADLSNERDHWQMLKCGFMIKKDKIEDVNGKVYDWVIPGLDGTRDKLAAWAISFEPAF